MKRIAETLAIGALAGLACGQALAAETPNTPAAAPAVAPGADAALAAPAPVPGTLDFQLAALSAKARPRAAVAAAPAALPADSVGLARRVIEAAGAFDAYTRKGAGLASGLKDGASVAKAVDAGAAYEVGQLQEGAVAYGALVALQDPIFVESVRDAAAAGGSDALADTLLERPASVLRLSGAHETAARVADVLGRRGAALIAAGQSIHKSSYAVQHEAWSKETVSHGDERLKAIKAASATRSVLADADRDALMSSLTGLRAGGDVSVAADWRPTPATAQSLAVAALAVLGRAGEDHGETVAKLLSTAQGADCLKMAKLNLYQCLAVAGPHYEHMFCLGQHAMEDTGQCLVSTAGWTGPLQSAPVLTKAVLPITPAPEAAAPGAAASPAAAPLVASVAVPIAVAALDGPERRQAAAALEIAAAPVDASPAAPPPTVEPAVARADVPTFAAPRGAEADDDAPPPAPRRYARAYTQDGYGRYAPNPYRQNAYAQDRYADARGDDADEEDDSAPPAYYHRPAYAPGYGPQGYGAYGYAAPRPYADDRD